VSARRLAEAIETSERVVADLASKAATLESFDDPADVKKLRAAQKALAEAKAEHDVLAERLAAAQRAEEAERKTKAAADLKAKQAKVRGEVEALAVEMKESLATVARQLARHESLVTYGLPGVERFQHWPPSYVEETCRSLGKAATTREVAVTFVVPLAPE
jgi:hypothetical protein